MPVSTLILADRNRSDLEKALHSVSWSDEVIVLSTSRQNTHPDGLKPLPCQVRFCSVAKRPIRIDAEIFSLAKHDWLLILAEGEQLSYDAPKKLQTWLNESADSHLGLALPRFNYLGTRLLMGQKWFPDHQLCLFNRKLIDRSQEFMTERPAIEAGAAIFDPPNCPHLHRHLGNNLLDYLQRQIGQLAIVNAAADPESYDWSIYLAQAQQGLAQVLETGPDGDLGQALELIGTWEHLIRGLLHWDSLDPQPPLELLPAFPVVVGELQQRRVAVRRFLLKRHSIRFQTRLVWGWLQSLWWRLRGYK